MSRKADEIRRKLAVLNYVRETHKEFLLGIDVLSQEDWTHANQIYAQGHLKNLGPREVILDEIKSEAISVADSAILFMMYGTKES